MFYATAKQPEGSGHELAFDEPNLIDFGFCEEEVVVLFDPPSSLGGDALQLSVAVASAYAAVHTCWK